MATYKTVLAVVNDLLETLDINKERETKAPDFIKHTADSEHWSTDVFRKAHGDLLPDDWRYWMIWRFLNKLTDAPKRDDSEAIEDSDLLEDAEFGGDQWVPYTHDQLNWLASNLVRHTYCDDARRDIGLGADTSMLTRIIYGMEAEYREVAASLTESILEIADEREAATV